jgi:hypothetical protein
VNRDMMKRNLHTRVTLLPSARYLDEQGRVVVTQPENCWIVQSVEKDGVLIGHISTGHYRVLGYDHIHKFTSDGSDANGPRGFLTLTVQVTVQGNEVRVVPTRPGEPAALVVPAVSDVLVDFNFPTQCGIQQRLESQGYRVSWSRPELVAKRLHDGCEVVEEPDKTGALRRFHLRDGMVLLKRRV